MNTDEFAHRLLGRQTNTHDPVDKQNQYYWSMKFLAVDSFLDRKN